MGKMVYYNSNKKGFTVAELMIVVAILVILAGISVPLFSSALRDYRLKQVDDQVSAAKAAAVAAFYAGYDSKNNPVDICQSGYCTFLYDAENNSVYVLNTAVDDISVTGDDFFDAIVDKYISYGYSIDRYGVTVDASNDYSDQVIIVIFEGRYFKQFRKINDKNHYSKGSLEEPFIDYQWVSAESLFK